MNGEEMGGTVTALIRALAIVAATVTMIGPGISANVLPGKLRRKAWPVQLSWDVSGILGALTPLTRSGRCYIHLYQGEEFQGRSLSIRTSRARRRSLRHNERSLRTVGDCCWRIYE